MEHRLLGGPDKLKIREQHEMITAPGGRVEDASVAGGVSGRSEAPAVPARISPATLETFAKTTLKVLAESSFEQVRVFAMLTIANLTMNDTMDEEGIREAGAAEVNVKKELLQELGVEFFCLRPSGRDDTMSRRISALCLSELFEFPGNRALESSEEHQSIGSRMREQQTKKILLEHLIGLAKFPDALTLQLAVKALSQLCEVGRDNGSQQILLSTESRLISPLSSPLLF